MCRHKMCSFGLVCMFHKIWDITYCFKVEKLHHFFKFINAEKHKNLKDGIEKEWNSPAVKCVKIIFNGRHGLNGHNGLLYTIMPESPFCPSSPSSPSNADF